jgi:hypothetical protein
LIKRFVKPQNTSSASPIVPVEATPVAVPPPAAITPPPAPELSNHVATQLDALRQMVPATETSKPTPGLPNPKAIMATTLAIAIMGGYIWLNNFKDLTVQAAAQKAGLSINMPSYMPSSYNLSGPISYGPGYLTMQYKSPSNETPLVLTQRKTDWSSASLLELFVNPKAKDYVTVQTQGLTIYVYNGNQATWVNRGKQFVIEGNTKLSKEQIVKIAESL